MLIERGSDGGVRVSVWSIDTGKMHAKERPGEWRAPVDALPNGHDSHSARVRIGYLQVELGDTGIGSTYDLMLAKRNDDDAGAHYEWGAVTSDTPRAKTRIFPQGSASYYEAVLGKWDDFVEDIRDDDRWMEPLSTWFPFPDEAS
jgi:hypothetical protein